MTKRKLLYILTKALFMSFFPKRSDKRKLQNKFITSEIELKFDPRVTFEIGEWYIIAMNLMDVKVEEGHGFVTKIEAALFHLSSVDGQHFDNLTIGEIRAKAEK